MAATLETEYIVVITLCSVLVVLVLVILSGLLFVLKRRRMFCFKGDAAARPFSIPDRRIEAGMQVTQETKPRRPFSNAKPSRQKKGKPRYKAAGTLALNGAQGPFRPTPLWRTRSWTRRSWTRKTGPTLHSTERELATLTLQWPYRLGSERKGKPGYI